MLTPKIYVADVEYIRSTIASHLGLPPSEVKTWRCPCGEPECKAHVVYARGKDGRLYFMANQTFQADPPYPTFIVDNVEDFDMFLRCDDLPQLDRDVFRIWFGQGLKEAVLSA